MSSNQRKVAQAFLDSFKCLDGDGNLALRTPDCLHTMAPASFRTNEMTNEQWGEHFSRVKATLVEFPVVAKEIFEQEGSNQVTIWATSEAIFREDAKDDDPDVDWSYHGEYIFILIFNKTGDKIQRIVEFLDSKKAIDVMELMQRARNNLAAKKTAPS